MLKMINIYGWFDAISLYEHSIAKNIQSTFRVGLQIPSKFNHFRWWIILQIPLNPGKLDSIPARTSPSKTNICCLIHQCSPYLLLESPVLKPIEPPTGQAIFVKWLLPRCLSVSPSAAIAGFRASARWSWRTLGLVVLVGTKMKKHIYTNTKQHVKRKACNYVNMNTYLEPQPVHTSPKSPIIPWSSHVSCLNSKHPIKNPAFS